MENNMGGARNTNLEKAKGYTTIHNTMEIGSSPYKAREEVPSLKARETETILETRIRI